MEVVRAYIRQNDVVSLKKLLGLGTDIHSEQCDDTDLDHKANGLSDDLFDSDDTSTQEVDQNADYDNVQCSADPDEMRNSDVYQSEIMEESNHQHGVCDVSGGDPDIVVILRELKISELDELVSEAVRCEAFECLEMLISHPDFPNLYIKKKGDRILHCILDHPGVYFRNEHYSTQEFKERCLLVVQALCRRMKECGTSVVSALTKTLDPLDGSHSALLLAILGDNLPVVQYGIQQGVNVNIDIHKQSGSHEKDDDVDRLVRHCPLMEAVYAAKIDIIKHMLLHGVYLDLPVGTLRSEVDEDDFTAKTALGDVMDNILEPNHHYMDLWDDIDDPDVLEETSENIRSDLLNTMILAHNDCNPLHWEDVFTIFFYAQEECMQTFLHGELKHITTTGYSTYIHDLSVPQVMFGFALQSDHEVLEMVLDHKEQLCIDIDAVALPRDKVKEYSPATGMRRKYGILPRTPLRYNCLTALQCAVLTRDFNVLRLLLEHGVHITDNNATGEMDVHPLCLIRLCQPQEKKYDWTRHLSLKVDSEALEVAITLLRYGCDPDSKARPKKTKDDDRLLFHFARAHDLLMCKLLFIAGARSPCRPIPHSHQYIFPRFRFGNEMDRYRFTDPEDFFTTEEVNSYTAEHLGGVSSLQKLTRTAVRSQIVGNVEQGIKSLKLPTPIQEYLNLSELDHPDTIFQEFIGKQYPSHY